MLSQKRAVSRSPARRSASRPCQNTLSLEDLAKISMVHKKYEETWRGDADGVRALFTDDSVLLPPHAGKPWIG